MKKRFLFLFVMSIAGNYSFSQSIGIGTTTPDPSAALEIANTAKGLLIPRMNTASINAIVNPARGLIVYDSVVNQLMVNFGTPLAPNWKSVVFGSAWGLNGNSGTNPVNQFIGNTDNQPLRFRINNIQAGELHPVSGNISMGMRANTSAFTGFSNIAIGTDALKRNTRSNIVGIGDSALFNNGFGASFPTNAVFNTAVGSKALFSNTLGSHNTAVGSQSLTNNGNSDNTAVGALSLTSNIGGSGNTATGSQALKLNTSGSHNTAIGNTALMNNTTGSQNTATGAVSMQLTTTGFLNTANGTSALRLNVTGSNNTAMGNAALFNNNGNNNTGIGVSALFATTAADFNTAVGYNAAFSFNMGFNNVMLGANSDANQNGLFNSVAIGESSRVTASSQVRLGNAFTNSIGGVVGYSNLSDGRYKSNIQENVTGLDFIMRLKPVTYQLNITEISNKLNPNKADQMPEALRKSVNEQEKVIFSGFVAQEVEKAAKDAGYAFSGVEKPKNENDFYGLRYSEFVVPLVKAIQEQQEMINELKKQNLDLLKRIVDLEKNKPGVK